MKQTLVLLFVVSVLITTPALAHGVAVADVSTFGAPISGATLTTVTSAGDFNLSVNIQVYNIPEEVAGVPTGKTIYTYVYSLFHDSTSDLVITTIFDMNFDLTLDAGYVGSDPFSADPDVGALALTFHFDSPANWDGDPLVAYAQSYYPHVEGIVYFGDNENLLEFGGFALTLGPGDSGSGAGLASTPEPASLLLLTSGLLSGGFLRFRKKRSNVKRTEESYEE